MSTVSDTNPAQNIVPPPRGKMSKDDRRWQKDRQDAQHTRLDRIQSSANVWLGILGTLFGLSGAVLLIKGSTAFVTSTSLWHVVLIILVILTFAAAILALVMGGAATWGGLTNLADPQPASHPVLDWLIPKLPLPGLRDSKKIIKRPWSKDPDPPYKDKYNQWADRQRAYLHFSRALGLAAALLAAAVVLWIFVAGTVSQTSPDIIVVHEGRVTCTTVNNAEKYTGVTQVISVGQC